MILVIRIKGIPSVEAKNKKTLHLLRLRKKFVAVLLNESPTVNGMLDRVSGCIAYGKITEETAKELILKRGRLIGDKKVEMQDAELTSFVKDLFAGKARLEDKKIKPFFSLHPPIGGFKKSTLIYFPKGILGNEGEKINDLVKRMLYSQ